MTLQIKQSVKQNTTPKKGFGIKVKK